MCASHRACVAEFTDRAHGSKFNGGLIRVYHISNYSPNKMLAFSSDRFQPRHTEASMVRAIDKELSAAIADSVHFSSTRSAVKCSISFDSVTAAIMALVDIVSKADMTYSMTLLRGERDYIEFGGAWTRVQFKQPSRSRPPKGSRTPKRFTETSQAAHAAKRRRV
jgi:hypothetical protein